MSIRFTNVMPALCLLSTLAAAQYQYTPTTTVAAEQGDNTSATSSWMTQFQPTATSQNVSKQPTRSLLYSGSNTKVYAAVMLWWGKSSHINVGYSSHDPAQVTRQVDDMVSRGIDGGILAWYGPDSYENSSTMLIKQEAEKRTNYKFAIMIDQGAIQWDSCSGCDPTHALIYDLNYIANTYYPSPAYLTIGGRPVIVPFGLEKYTIDWNLVRASVNGNPLFVFRNPNGFTVTQSDGAYGWIEPTQDTATDPYDLAYLDSFYSKSLNYLSTKVVIGSAYPGFDDKLASWGSNRFLTQDCGQTWLATFAEAGKYYSSAKQLPNMQLVTWNDYEEGTATEGGIDNCVSVSSTISGTTLSWTPTGKENTLKDYTVFVSQDENQAAVLTTVPVSTHSLDLSTYQFGLGTWYFYVRATAKAGLQNHFAPPATLNVTSTAAGATMQGPAPGSTLSGSSTTFNWSPGTNVTEYWLWVGTNGPGSLNLYDANQHMNLSTVVNGIPTNGQPVYVRLFTDIDGVFQYNDYVYTEQFIAVPAAMLTPANGSTLPGASATFTWNTGTNVSEYWLWVGTAPGTYNLYDVNQYLNTSTTVPGLPTNGQPVYVRLYSWINGAWQYNDYVYTASLN